MPTIAEIVGSVRPDIELTDELATVLSERVASAIAAWPDVHVDPERLVRAICERVPSDATGDLAITAQRAEDLYLMCALVEGDARAILAFDRLCGPAIERAVAAAGATAAQRDDLRQVVRQRLLVAAGDGTPPRIATYSGAGALVAWVRVVATREAVRMLPREAREIGDADDELARLIAPDEDPEVGYLKRLYRHEFKQAFQAAVGALDDRDRLLLRQHTLDGLSIDQLAALHGVHRASAARWVQHAREAVLENTQRELSRALNLTQAEVVSVIRLIRSQLDVSLPRILQEE